jgi:hypothetical protein
MAHALLGVVVALYFPLEPVIMAIIIGSLKECLDLLRAPIDRASALDSAQDVSFWALGAWLVMAGDKNLAVIFLVFGLVCGIIPRLRRLRKAG